MQIVIDTNIIISALIKDSHTRRLILQYPGYFLVPEYIFVEIEKYKSLILEKSGFSNDEFKSMVSILRHKMTVIPRNSLIPYNALATEIMRDIDPDDAVFIACALANDAILWSDDKRLKQQDVVAVMNTVEFTHMFISRI